MTQTCQSGVALLMEYLEGTIAPDVAAAIEQHVSGCQRCQAFVESYRRTPDIFRNATTVELTEDLARSLQEALQRER